MTLRAFLKRIADAYAHPVSLGDAVNRLQHFQHQSHETLLGQIGQLGQRLDRLEAAIAHERAPVLDALARTELAQHRSHETLLGQIGQLGQRLDRLEAAIAHERAPVLDALARTELAQHQSHETLLGQIGQLGQRLDRLEAAQVTNEARAASSFRELTESLHRIAASSRPTAARPAFSGPYAELGHVLDVLDATAIAALRAMGASPGRAPIYVRDDSTADSPVEVALSAMAAFVAARSALPAGSLLVWRLPASCNTELSEAELIQLIGLIGWNARVIRGVGTTGNTIVTALRRTELVVPIVRWTVHALRKATGGDRGVSSATPAIVLEPVADEAQAMVWAADVADALVEHRRRQGAEAPAICGIVWPQAALEQPQSYAAAASALRSRLTAAGFDLAFQWVDGVPPITRSGAVLALADAAGVRVDLTPTIRTQTAGAFAAYDDLCPYQPMPFDLRIPNLAPTRRKPALFCCARQDAALVPPTDDPFAEVVGRRAARLAQVFDRARATRFREAVAAGFEPAGAWERWIIYNWKTPEPVWVRAVAFQAGDPTLAAASVGAGTMDALLPHLRRFEALHEEAAAHYRAMQIAVHDYLPEGRQSASADSVRLASWFPDSLGDTLEVGSGYGVLARTFIDRTDRYVGLDLTLQQARAIDRLGGTGVVGDIHALPFPDSRFDTVVADNVIEHALDPLRALTEIRRVLKASGRGYFVIPLDYLSPDYSNDAHLWKADERSIQAAFEAAGFEVIKHEICVLPEIGAQGSFPSCDQRTSLWEVRPVGALTAGAHVDEERIVLDWRAMLRVQAPDIADIADRVTRQVLALNTTSDLTPLARKSPALRDFDWTGYLQLSQIRIVRTASCLVRRGVRGRVLDIGSYFGNFAMTLAELGFEVTALDSYAAYAPAFDQHVTAMRAAGVTVADTAVFGTDLTGFDPEAFDAVLCMGVIEHVPHTPRLLLAAMDRVLKRGGLLVIDTPNLAYEYKRQQMSKGLSVFAPIETQFETEIPFEGHHREYTPSEVRWMIKRIGYVDLEIEMYDYSLYGLSELRGDDVARWRAMQSDPERRELIFASARKPA